jgi:uncharacterized protein (DUF952 family)
VHNVILHIVSRDELSECVADGEYRAPSLADVGFTHCSDPGTVHLPANALYAGRTDLLLMVIDPALLTVPVRWEPGEPPPGRDGGEKAQPGGPWFPHVYGPISMSAVLSVLEFPSRADGTFQLPTALAEARAT